MNKKLKNLSDDELALQLQALYDPVIFNELAARYRQKINNQCRLLVRNTDTAEDLTQEIFIKVFMKISSFKGDSHFSTWIFSITHNTCIDYLRKHKKSLYQQLTAEVAEAFEEEEAPEESVDFSIEKFDAMLEEMEPETRTILILRYKQNLSVKEIQEHLHISESAVKMRLLRARDKIKRYLYR